MKGAAQGVHPQEGKKIYSCHFRPRQINIGGTTEWIVKGGRQQRQAAIAAMKAAGIKVVCIIGFKSQGGAQARNLKKSLEKSGIKVVVGLRRNSVRRAEAREAGFNEEDGTLMDVYQAVRAADLVLLLIDDQAQVAEYNKIFRSMKRGAYLGFSHGFLIKHLQSIGVKIPKHIKVIGCCPKGMGDTVRRYFLKKTGINCSVAIHQKGNASLTTVTDVALAWGTLIGAPFMFLTTLGKECVSDLTGERSGLLAAPFGLVEAVYDHWRAKGVGGTKAYMASVYQTASLLRRHCSKHGVLHLYSYFAETGSGRAGKDFRRIYNLVYPRAYAIISEIYDDVESGAEIASVIRAGKRMGGKKEMEPIATTEMWKKFGPKARKKIAECQGTTAIPVSTDPVVAGAMIAILMALTDVLASHGHVWTEIANESWIELFDSLLAYMEQKGIDAMVDGCSVTARLGTRKWWSAFKVACSRALDDYENGRESKVDYFADFLNHPIHDALRVCYKLRPPTELDLAA